MFMPPYPTDCKKTGKVRLQHKAVEVKAGCLSVMPLNLIVLQIEWEFRFVNGVMEDRLGREWRDARPNDLIGSEADTTCQLLERCGGK